MYGPPGSGKTSLVRAVASKRYSSFFYTDSASIYSSYVGQAERYLESLFHQARQNLPAIIFIDEIDAVVTKRGKQSQDSSGSMEGRILATLLNEMDGITNDIANGLLIIAATNRLYAIDDALLRPGRFDELIYVPPPNEIDRLKILQIYTQNTPLHHDVDLDFIAKQTDMYSGADLENLVRESCMYAIRDSIDKPVVENRHFQLALLHTKPSLTKEQIDEYQSDVLHVNPIISFS